jgi:hypothetical protein
MSSEPLKAKIFSSAHRLAVSLNPAYQTHYREWQDGQINHGKKADGSDMGSVLSPRKEVQHRWGLHGEEPIAPVSDVELRDDEAKALLRAVSEELEELDDIDREDYDELSNILSTWSFLEEIIRDQVPGAYFESDPAEYWRWREPPYIVPPSMNARGPIEGWGVVNAELNARQMWQLAREQLDLNLDEEYYRIFPARRMGWVAPSGKVLSAIGRDHLLVGIQNVTRWVESQEKDLKHRLSGDELSLPFFDPASSTRVHPNPKLLKERIEDSRRGTPLQGLLYVGGKDEGREVFQRMRQLIHLIDDLRSEMESPDTERKKISEADPDEIEEPLEAAEPLKKLNECLSQALRSYMRHETPQSPVLFKEMTREKLFRYAAKEVFLVALTDGTEAKLPNEDFGPSEKVRQECQDLGGHTYDLLSSNLKKEIKDYQKHQFKTLSTYLTEAIEDRFDHSVEVTYRTVHMLIFMASGYDRHASFLNAVFNCASLFEPPRPPEKRSSYKLLSNLVYYMTYDYSDLSQSEVAEELNVSSRTVRTRFKKARKFIESRDFWRHL